MDQESINQSPLQSFNEKKEANWQNIISLVFLVFFPLFGLILMWLLASWSRKIKVIITVVYLIPLIFIIIVVCTSLGTTRTKANEVRVITTLSFFRAAAALIYEAEKSYINFNCDYKSSLVDVASGCEDIERIIGKKPIFHSSSDAFCVYVKLPSKKYACLDSTGRFNKAVTTFPGQHGYCDGITFICPE